MTGWSFPNRHETFHNLSKRFVGVHVHKGSRKYYIRAVGENLYLKIEVRKEDKRGEEAWRCYRAKWKRRLREVLKRIMEEGADSVVGFMPLMWDWDRVEIQILPKKPEKPKKWMKD